MELSETMVHYGISVMGPTISKVKAGAEWVARTESPYLVAFGATPDEAVDKLVRLRKELLNAET